MPSINSVQLMGHLGQDPETRYTANGKAVTKFSLATEHRYKSGDEWRGDTTWHNIVAWDLHEKTRDAIRKGSLVHISGRIQNRSYDDNSGTKRYVSEVVAERVIFLRDANQEGPPRRQETARAAAPAPQPAPRPQQRDDFISDDDLPF